MVLHRPSDQWRGVVGVLGAADGWGWVMGAFFGAFLGCFFLAWCISYEMGRLIDAVRELRGDEDGDGE